MALMRLDKLLSDMGLAARRELKEKIRSGAVTVDGQPVTRPEFKLDPAKSAVTVDGETIRWQAHHYYVMDKPAGVVTATEDRAEKTVLDLLPAELRRMGVFPVGRLDKDTTGLLLLSDDGEFAHRVISPRSCVEKLYYTKVEGEPDASDAEAFSRGIILADGTQCLPARLTPLGGGTCLIALREGKYHQVKRMMAARGKPVLELRRLAVGGLRIGDELGPGGWRELDDADLCKLFEGEGREN